MDVRRHVIGIARLVFVAAALGFFLSGGTSDGDRAGALDGNAGPVAVTVAKTLDGSGATIRAEAPQGVLIYEMVAHLCRHDSGVRTVFDFNFQGTKCTRASVGGSDVEQVVAHPNGTTVAEIPYFKLGFGAVSWVNSRGELNEIACGPGQPCDLVVQLQITDGTVHFPATLCFDEACAPGTVGGEVPPPPPAPAEPEPAAEPAPAPDAPDGAAAADPAEADGAATAGTGKKSGAAADKAGPAGDAGAKSEGKQAAGSTSSSSSKDPNAGPSGVTLSVSDGSHGASRATRVRAAAVAGVAGGALITGLVTRGRRRISGVDFV